MPLMLLMELVKICDITDQMHILYSTSINVVAFIDDNYVGMKTAVARQKHQILFYVIS